MSILPVFLWADVLLWSIVVLAILGGIIASRDEILAETWGRVFKRPVAMICFLVISFFLFIALLDSMHFRRSLSDNVNQTNPSSKGPEASESADIHYSPQVESVLDLVLADLKNSTEKSYSRPFAAHAFSKEFVESADGSLVREFPRLEHAGRHLLEPEITLVPDVLLKSAQAVLQGAFAGVLLSVALIAVWFRPKVRDWWVLLRRVRSHKSHSGQEGEDCEWVKQYPFRSLIGTLMTICAIAWWAIELSSYYHVLGTDQVGADVLYVSLKSVRTGVVIGMVTTLVLLPIAITLGVCAGYFGGVVDDAIQYLYITLNSIPGVLLIVALVMILEVYISSNAQSFLTAASRADLKLVALCGVLGMTSWTSLCRLLRAETLKLRELDYVQAARAFGVSPVGILWRHVLPNLFHLVLISLVIDFSGLVLAEAVLSYIGVGVDPAMPSWGNMINSARMELARSPVVWWPLSAAFLFMFTLVLSANLFADVVREVLNPKSRERV